MIFNFKKLKKYDFFLKIKNKREHNFKTCKKKDNKNKMDGVYITCGPDNLCIYVIFVFFSSYYI